MNINVRLLGNHLAVLLLMFGFKYLPPFGQMTEFGMAVLGMFFGLIYGWLTLGFLMPSVCGIFALASSGAYDSIGACFAATFGSVYTPLMIGCLFIAAVMNALNLTDVLVGKLLNLDFAKKNMTVFFMLFFMTTWIVSLLTNSGIITIILFIELYASMAAKAGIPQHSRMNSFILCGIIFAGMIGNISLPFKVVALSIMGLFKTYAGFDLSFMDYVLYVTSYQVVLLILYPLIGRYILRLDFTMFTPETMEQQPMNSRQKAGLACLGAMFLGFVLTTQDIAFFSWLGLGGVGLATFLLMLVWQVDGKPLLQPGEVAGKFDWGMFFMMDFFMIFIGFVSSPAVGLTATVQNSLAPMLTSLSPSLLVVISILGAVIVSNLLNNWPVVIIFISILGIVAKSVTDIQTGPAIIAIAVAGYLAFATPMANPGSAMAYGHKELIKPSTHMLVAGVVSMILGAITALVYYPLLCTVIG